MAKIQFSDVVPPEKRSIRNIPIPNSGKRKVSVDSKPKEASLVNQGFVSAQESGFVERVPTPKKLSDMTDIKNNQAYEYYYPKEKEEPALGENNKHLLSTKMTGKKRFLFGGAVLVVVGIFIFSMMTVFASATVLITPKSQNVEVSMDVVGTGEIEDGGVRYEVIKLSKTQTTSVQAAGEESVKLEAHGTIVIYNSFSTEPQRLIVRTRFETPEGLIYRIPESVTVPGKSTKDGVETPGSIEVEVFADEPGEKYNIKKTDFTVPGFKNDTARYKGFYARSSTAMTGGFVGKMKTVLPADKQAALQKIDLDAATLLEKELQSKVPEGLVLLPGAIIYNSHELPQTEESSSVVIGKDVTAFAVMLNSKDLSGKIVDTYLKEYSGWEKIKATINDFSLLRITKKPEKLEAGQKVNLEIKGSAKILANIDTNLISQKLIGTQKKEVTKLMDEFAGISGIVVTLRPIWKQSFPDNPAKITIKTDLSR